MALWQNAMIRLARSQSVTRFAQSNPFLRRLASQFVGGVDVESAIAKVTKLKKQGFTTSLYYLGEYLDSSARIEENVAQIIDLIGRVALRVALADLDVLISVDPTQIGYSLSDELGQENALRIAQVTQGRVGSGRRLMLDMEDFSLVQPTLVLRSYLAQNGYPAAITIQAYLRRSEQDIRLIPHSGYPKIRHHQGEVAVADWADLRVAHGLLDHAAAFPVNDAEPLVGRVFEQFAVEEARLLAEEVGLE
jgi:proline dehydrogenase